MRWQVETACGWPVYFLRYTGWRGVNAKIMSATGVQLTVSATNLRPMHPLTHVDEYVRHVELGAVPSECELSEALPDRPVSSATSGSSISDPPGV